MSYINLIIIINTTSSYIIGGIISILIFAYLVYSLVKPDKF